MQLSAKETLTKGFEMRHIQNRTAVFRLALQSTGAPIPQRPEAKHRSTASSGSDRMETQDIFRKAS